MAGFERLVVRIDGDGKGLTAELQRVGGAVNNFNTKVNKASRDLEAIRKRTTGLVGAFRDVVVSLSSVQTLFYQAQFYAGGFIGKLIEANAQFERMSVLLTGLSKANSAAGRQLEASSNLKWIRQMAKETPFAMQALGEAFVRFKTIGIDPTNGSLKALTDSVAAFGGNTQVLERASVAIQQMAGKGVISMEELRQQLGEAIPNAVNLMARAVNMSYAEFVKLVSQGKVKAGPALAAFFQELERVYGGAGQRMMNTYTGLLSRLQTTFQEFAIKVNESPAGGGFFDVLKKQMEELNVFLNSGAGSRFASDLGEAIATIIVKLSQLIKFIYEYRDTIIAVGKIMLTVWAGKAVIGGLAGLGSMIGKVAGFTRAYIGTLGSMAMGQTRVVAATQRSITAFNRMASGIVYINGAQRGLIASTMAVGSRLLGMVGIIGTAVSALMLLTSWFNTAASAANRLAAARKAAATGQVRTEDELKEEASGVSNARKKYLASKSETDRYLQMQKEGKQISSYMQERIRQTKELEGKLKAVEGTYTTNMNNYRNDLTDQMIDNNKRNFDRDTNQTVDAAQAAYRRQAEKLDEARAKLKPGDKAGAAALTKKSEVLVKLRDTEMMNYWDRRAKDVETWAKGKGAETVAAATRAAEEYRAKAGDLRSQIANPVDVSAGNLLTSGKGDGKKKKGGKSEAEKEADRVQNKIEALRGRWVNLQIEADKLKFELEHGGDTDGFDTDESQEKAEENAQKAITTIEAGKTAINNLKDANAKAVNDMRKANVLSELNSDLELSKSRVVDLYNSYTNGFQSISLKVRDFERSQRDRYSGEFKKYASDATYIESLNKKITDATAEYRKEVLIDAAGDVKDRNRDLLQGLMTERQVREENYQLEVARINDLIQQLTGKGELEGKLAMDLNTYLQNLQKNKALQDSGKGPLAKWALDAKDLKKNIGDTLPSMLDGFASTLAEGKMAFGDFAKSLLQDLTKIILRAVIAKAILNAIGLGAGSSSGGVDVSGMSHESVHSAHTGGMVGSLGTRRGVDASMFRFAKRYHGGGFPGLADDEVPIIARKGEGVFTPEQMRAMGSGTGGSAAAPQINIINQTSEPVKQETTGQRWDGEKFVIDVVLKHMNKPGPLRTAINSGK